MKIRELITELMKCPAGIDTTVFVGHSDTCAKDADVVSVCITGGEVLLLINPTPATVKITPFEKLLENDRKCNLRAEIVNMIETQEIGLGEAPALWHAACKTKGWQSHIDAPSLIVRHMLVQFAVASTKEPAL